MLFRRKQKLNTVELPDFTFCREAGGLAAWAANLPDVNGQMLARMLLQAGDEILKQDCDSAQKVQIALTLKDAFIKARDNLYELEVQAEHVKNVVTLEQSFFSCFGNLFVSVAKNAIDTTDWVNSAEVLRLTAECFSETIIASLALYRPPFPGSWKQMHNLHMALSTSCPDANILNQVNSFYIRTVALACLQTAQLDYENIQILKSLCEKHNVGIKLLAEPSPNCSYQIVVGKDQAPEKIITIEDEATIIGDKLYVDLSALNTLANKSDCPRNLKTHLDRALDYKVQPKEERQQITEALKLCLSLDSLHIQLSGCKNLNAFVANISSPQSEPEINTSVDTDIWSSAHDSSWDSSQHLSEVVEFEMVADAIKQADESIEQMQADKEHNDERAMALDKSSSGYLIACEAKVKGIQAGALVGLQAKANKAWTLAAIRWQRSEGQFNKYGVEIIADSPVPAAVKVLRSNIKTDFIPAMRLTSVSDDEFIKGSSEPVSSHFEVPNDDNSVIVTMSKTELRDRAPVLFIDVHGERRGIVKEVLEDNIHYLVCLIHLAD